MRPEYHTESSEIDHKLLKQDAAPALWPAELGSVTPSIRDKQVSNHYTIQQSVDNNAASGSHFAYLDLIDDTRELYATHETELARLTARRIKLGMFATRKTREELDDAIDARARLYERQAGFIDHLQIEEWRMRSSNIEEEELARNLAEYHIERERLHEQHIDEAFHQIRRFGTLSEWNDRMSEWYVGLSREYQIGVAMGATAISAVAGGMTAWSTDALSPTAAVVSGGVLAGAKIYKVYNQARLGIYEELDRKEEPSDSREEINTGAIGRIRGRLGGAALSLAQRSGVRWDGFVQKISNRRKGMVAPVTEPEGLDGDENEHAEPSEILSFSDRLHVEATSRMERRRRERVERTDKINKRAKIAVIGAGVLAAVGIGSRFIDFGKITDWFGDRPLVGVPSPSSSPTPTPTASLTQGIPETPVGDADGSSLTPSVEEPSQLKPPLDQPSAPLQPEYDIAAVTVENGEGWYQTFSEMGITDPTEQANLLCMIGPDLVAHGWAYTMPDNSYGISRPGVLPRQALDLIANNRL